MNPEAAMPPGSPVPPPPRSRAPEAAVDKEAVDKAALDNAALDNAALDGAVLATLSRLSAVVPDAADDAGAWLGRVLGPLSASQWPEAAWRFSRLTNTGMPVEFAWSSRETAVRWTAEVAPPETADAGRLALAAAWLDWPLDLQPWLRMQRSARLKYGTWIGARHSPASTHKPVSTKLYVEVPVGVALPGREAHPLLRSEALIWRMVGLNADGSREYYARGPELDLACIAAMAQAVCGDGKALTAHAMLLTGGHELPRPSGISLTLAADDTPLALTWFTFAKAIFRDDRAVSAWLREQAQGTSAQIYAALAAGAADDHWRHGMIGVGIDAQGAGWVQCGLRPR